MADSLRFNKIWVRWQRRCPQNFCIEEYILLLEQIVLEAELREEASALVNMVAVP
jgi:hypothetical protein